MGGQAPQAAVPGSDDLKSQIGEVAYAIVQEARQQAAAERVKANQYEALGSLEDLTKASAIYEATQSEAGLRQIIAEAEAALQGVTDPDAAALPDPDPNTGDVVLTPEDLQRMTVDAAQKTIRQELDAYRSDAETQALGDAIQAKLDELGVSDPQARADVLSRSNEFVPENVNHRNVGDAIAKGLEQYNTYLEELGQIALANAGYLAEKRQVAEEVPVGITGSSVVGSDEPKPKSVADVHQRVREKMRSQGLED